jgi:hypothetical protein
LASRLANDEQMICTHGPEDRRMPASYATNLTGMLVPARMEASFNRRLSAPRRWTILKKTED